MRSLVILLFLSFVTIKGGIKAQVSITQQDLASSGDTLRFSTASIIGVDYDTTGPNRNWNYQDLNPTGQGIDEFKSFIRTPYLFYSQFFGAIGLKTADTLNFGILTITNVHTFYRKRSTSYTAEGTGFTVSGVPLASDYSNSDRVYKLPLNYGDNDADNFRVATSVPGVGTFIQQGTRSTLVDGWGKISTPFAKNVDCIRVISNVQETDSLVTQFVSFGFPVNRREIKWLSKTEPIPMMEVSGPVIGSLFTPSQVKYRDSFRNIQAPSVLRAGFSTNRTSGMMNDTFKLTGNVNLPVPAQFNWRFAPNNVNYVNGTSSSDAQIEVIFTDTGKYDVSLNATFLNQSDDTTALDLITINSPSSVQSLLESSCFAVRVFGNAIHFQTLQKEVTYEIYNMNAALVQKGRLQGEGSISLSSLPTGKYILISSNGEGKQVKFAFLKQTN